jgi:hypothetical protein
VATTALPDSRPANSTTGRKSTKDPSGDAGVASATGVDDGDDATDGPLADELGEGLGGGDFTAGIECCPDEGWEVESESGVGVGDFDGGGIGGGHPLHLDRV